MLRIFIFLVGAILFAAGLAFAVAPARTAADFALGATGVAGLGTLRADLGAMFLTAAGFTFAGLRAGAARWLVVPAILIGGILALRLLHLAVDGMSDAGVRATVAELVFVTLLLAGWRRLPRA